LNLQKILAQRMKMNHLKRRSICKSCRVTFVRDSETQVYCFGCLQEAELVAKGFYKTEPRKKKCLACGTMFSPMKGSSTCSSQCREQIRYANQKKWLKRKEIEKTEDDGLTEEARRWLNKKTPDHSNNRSYTELNKIAEHSRVFGKHSLKPLYFARKGFGRV